MRTLTSAWCLALIVVTVSGCAAQPRPAAEAPTWSWQRPHAEVLPTGDLKWTPEPFEFHPGQSVRYIDFENGDDDNSGTSKASPWKHHPWDENATGRAEACSGVHTYVFKRGSIYRGRLVAEESGQPGNPIRLTSDPDWGEGEAAFYGSRRISGGWNRCTAEDVPEHMPQPTKVWYKDIGTEFTPRAMWMLEGKEAVRIPVAREPDWEITNWSDPMSEWWTFTGRIQADGERWAADTEHLMQDDPKFFDDGVMWNEWRGNMGTLTAQRIGEFRPDLDALDVGAPEGCRYYIENVPGFLDSPGEFYSATDGPHAGRLYARLPGDRDPNGAVIEVSRAFWPVEIANQSHISIIGLRFSFDDAGHRYATRMWPERKNFPTTIRLVGDCRNIRIANNRFIHVTSALIGQGRFDDEGNQRYFSEEEGFSARWREPVPPGGDRMTGIVFSDNEVRHSDRTAVCLEDTKSSTLTDVQVLRNSFSRIGSRPGPVSYSSIPCIYLRTVETCEIAGNIIDRCWGCGIVTFGGKGQNDRRTIPLIRVLIHHNKATNTLLATNDWGGIAPWQGGPNYVYDNVSGNAVGPKHSSKDSEEWACNAYTYYLDGTYKSYVFNNIAWGLTGDLDDWPRNRGGCMQVLGMLNNWFNNTAYRFMYGFTGSSGQRCSYLGNCLVGMTQRFFSQGVPGDISMRGGGQRAESVIGMMPTLSYANNVFHGSPGEFARVGSAGGQTLEEFRRGLAEANVPRHQVGWTAHEQPLRDPDGFDFRPAAGSAAADRGVRFFVPWSLAAVVGEWNFYNDPNDPERITGENFYMTDEYVERHMYYYVPRNDLRAPGATAEDYTTGKLENWVDGALRFDGCEDYCVLPHDVMTADYTYRYEKEEHTYPGEKRRTVDMGTNNFLIETYFRTEPGHVGGTLVSKMDHTGYTLQINRRGGLTLTLRSRGAASALADSTPVNDGAWHHAIAEVDRGSGHTRIYLDGHMSAEIPIKNIGADVPLSNAADFLVGKSPDGAYFAGEMDFLRVSRGTLADAQTTIEELYAWEFDGPFLRDFCGAEPIGRRDAGAVEGNR